MTATVARSVDALAPDRRVARPADPPGPFARRRVQDVWTGCRHPQPADRQRALAVHGRRPGAAAVAGLPHTAASGAGEDDGAVPRVYRQRHNTAADVDWPETVPFA